MKITKKYVRKLLKDKNEMLKLKDMIKSNGTSEFRKNIADQIFDIGNKKRAKSDPIDFNFNVRQLSFAIEEIKLTKIKRSTGEKAIEGLLKRAKRINESKDYLIKINKIYLFGSMLGDSPFVGDVDLIVKYEKKEGITMESPEWEKQMKECKIYSWMAVMFFPITKTLRYLKNKKTSISIHDERDLELGMPTKLIFEG
jgi:predicted nucleotidyltransferase